MQRVTLFLPDEVVTELETRAGGNAGGYVADVLRQTFERTRALEAMDRMRTIPPEKGVGESAAVAAEVVEARRAWAPPPPVRRSHSGGGGASVPGRASRAAGR